VIDVIGTLQNMDNSTSTFWKMCILIKMNI